MLEIKKIEKNIQLDKEIIQKFCQQEKEILLKIIPDEQFFNYTLYFNNEYKVLCLYRQNILLKYSINNIDDLVDIHTYLNDIHKILCYIVCEQAKNDILTENEENYILQFIYNFSKNVYTDTILKYYHFLPQKIQRVIYNIIK